MELKGLLQNSVWNNVTTMTDVVANNVRNWTINGGTHQMTVTSVPVGNLTWNITNQTADGLNINLPVGTPAGLVRINTDNQDGEEANWTEVRRWLFSELGGSDIDNITGVSQARLLGETAPTSGYWLPHPPLAPPIEYPIVVEVPENASGFLTIRNLDANTNEDFVVTNGAVVGNITYNQ